MIEQNRLLNLYRQLLRGSRRIKNVNKRGDTVNEIKSVFKKALAAHSQEQVNELVNFSKEKLSYIKIIGDSIDRSTGSVEKYIMLNGKLVPGSEKLERKSVKSGMDPDNLAKHKYLLERQHFMHRM